MKTVKIKFVNFWDNFDQDTFLPYIILKKHYNVVIDDDADYVFCSAFGRPYEYCKYPQIRIMYSGENYIPDLNLVDYAFSYYPFTFFDRVSYFPGFLMPFSHSEALKDKDRDYSDEILLQKPHFANFIFSHESEYGIRGNFFKRLSQYKRVDSIGTYLNNMPNGETVSMKLSNKTDFQKKCKFTLCFESTKHEGFITEKITDAFYSDTIPIYYGSSNITEIFNPKAFINCLGVNDFERVVEQIMELDQNDDKYLEMLRQPIFNDENFLKKSTDAIEKFLINIFDQPIEDAYRRSRVYSPKRHEDYLKEAKIIPKYTSKELFKMLLKSIIN